MPLPTVKSSKESNYLKKIYLWYGAPKVGKTTIAAGFGDDDKNKVLFFATEPGHKFQEIYSYQVTDKKTGELVLPSKWEHWVACCKELATTKHDFKCVAIDTLDNLYKWCSIYTLKRLGITHESELGFGKGYHAVRDEFFIPLNYLTQNGYGLIFISHEDTQERQRGPRKIAYTDTTLPGTCRKLVHGITDYIFYFGMDFEGKRWIRTKGSETVNAGDRSGILPEKLPMDAEVLKKSLTSDALKTERPIKIED